MGATAPQSPVGAPPPASAPLVVRIPNGTIYVWSQGFYHGVPDPATFLAAGYQWSQVVDVAAVPGPIGAPLPSVLEPRPIPAPAPPPAPAPAPAPMPEPIVSPPSETVPPPPDDADPDAWNDWPTDLDADILALLEGMDDDAQFDFFFGADPAAGRQPLIPTAGFYRATGAPGCDSHSPPSSCIAYRGLSAANHCAPKSAPCNWESCNAVDVVMPVRTKLTPCERGIVSPPGTKFSGWGFPPNATGRFAGARLHIVHPGGWVSFYTHLSQLPFVTPGQQVGRDTIIGVSGIANGLPHCHFAVTPPRDPRTGDLWKTIFLRGTGGGTVPPPPGQTAPGVPPPLVLPGVGGLEDAWHKLMRDSWDTRRNASGALDRAHDRLKRFVKQQGG